MYHLRPYQQDSVDSIRLAYQEKHKAPLLVLSTGAGKTVVFCHIAESTSLRGKRVWVLVHRRELLRQTSEKLTENGVPHSLINPNYTPDFNSLVQVVSVQTAIKRLHKLNDNQHPDLIIIDEAHHATAGSWNKIINYFPNAYILGVTATPIRTDGTGLDGIFDKLIVGPQIAELIQQNYLVKPIVYAPKNIVSFDQVKITRGDFDKDEVAKLIDKPTITGDAVAQYRKVCPGVPTVVFCVSIDHAKHVAEQFQLAGYRFYSVDGSMDSDTRDRILQGLGNGTIDGVTSCDLISEGTDIPNVQCAIFLRPTQSLGLYIQQGGRALRTAPNKNCAYILDHVGNTFIHGFLNEDREWTLEGRKRGKSKKSDQMVKVMQCVECYVCHEPADVCPSCGHVYEKRNRETMPEEVGGELHLLTPEEKMEKKRNLAIEISQAKTMPELLKIQKKMGYKNGWAYHLFSSRKNRKPEEIYLI